jgi:hypothetical protein
VGLAGLPHGFGAIYTMSGKPAIHGTTDVFYSRINTTTPARLGLPSGRQCRSRRQLTIHLRSPRGDPIRTATVIVAGHRARVLRGRRLGARILLTGLPKGRYRVRISARTRSGQLLSETRVYRTCQPRTARTQTR